MNKKLSVLFLGFLLLAPVVWAQSSMTDEQVLQYVITGLQSGKEQKEIAMELARRGVTQEQAMRVKSLYEKQQSEGTAEEITRDSKSRKRRLNNGTDESEYIRRNFELKKKGQTSNPYASPYGNTYGGYTGNPYSQSQGRGYTNGQRNLYEYSTAGNRIIPEKEMLNRQSALIDEELNMFYPEYPFGMNENMEPEKEIFGRNIFNSSNLTFEPSTNIATPKNYRLGAGDEIIIDIWGDNETSIREEISPDGTISIESLGVVYLTGKTIAEARQYLQKELAKIYSGLDDETSDNHMQLSLGQSRTIQVNVMGEVLQPGTYTLSSFATVFHAIYRAGGVGDIGSLRKIELVRNGKSYATLDLYEFIMKGQLTDDLQLMEGDVIIVPVYDQLVEVTGNVKRPMFYEMKNGETLENLFQYSGGLSNNAYTKNIRIIRQNGNENEVCTIDTPNFSSFQTQDGDAIEVESVLDRYTNKLEIKGAVYRPGLYQLGKIQTVKQLIEAADGVMGDAFLNRAVLQRENDNLTRSVLSIDIAGIMKGSCADVALQKNDILYIPSIHDLKDMGTLTIHGEIARPGEYVYAENMTLEDLIIQAGGLLESASTSRVDVARRIKDAKSEKESNIISETYRFSLKDGFVIDGENGFILKPYDEIYVRQSPSYQKQQNITIQGEILFPGDYALTHKTERISDIIEKAGGPTSHAYVKGARLIRKMNEEEKLRQESAKKMAETSKDSISTKLLDISATYTVGIDLQKALDAPGSDADLVLRDGDIIEIPEFTNTVKISGAVMYPNVVSYIDGKKVKYYIDQAGGFGNDAKKRKAYIVCMNGQVKRAKLNKRSVVEPGCEIIVPLKGAKSWNVQQTMSVATASASLATMVATIANIIK